MPDFNFQVLTQTPSELDVISSPIGDNTNQASDNDLGKAVKLGADQNYVLAANGDELEGVIDTVRGDTVNQGYSFGGIQRKGRIYATVGANQGATPMAVRDYVLADDQVAFGIKPSATYAPVVKTGAPATHKWRCIRVIGDGTAGSTVLLERQ